MNGLEENSEEGPGGREGLCQEKTRGPAGASVLRREQTNLCSRSARGPLQREQGHRGEQNSEMRTEVTESQIVSDPLALSQDGLLP